MALASSISDDPLSLGSPHPLDLLFGALSTLALRGQGHIPFQPRGRAPGNRLHRDAKRRGRQLNALIAHPGGNDWAADGCACRRADGSAPPLGGPRLNAGGWARHADMRSAYLRPRFRAVPKTALKTVWVMLNSVSTMPPAVVRTKRRRAGEREGGVAVIADSFIGA